VTIIPWLLAAGLTGLGHSGIQDGDARNVSFEGVGGLSLQGTLLAPRGSGKRPAVLLLPGSGPTDRDGNQPPALVTDLLKQIAEALAEEGVVTLRFDKRAAAGYAKHWPQETEKLGEFMSWESFVDDAAAALAFLRTQPEVDPARVAVAGHSEGGLIALQIGADAAADDRPAALLLLATPGRSLDHLLREQIAAALLAQKAPEEVRAMLMKDLNRAIALVVEKGTVPGDLHPGIQPLFPPYAARILRSYFQADPVQLAGRFPGPVLVLQGEKDVQVHHERDGKILLKALSSRSEGAISDLAIVPGTSHNLKKVEDAADPGFAGPVVEPAMKEIRSWLRKHLIGSAGALPGRRDLLPFSFVRIAGSLNAG
jgi:uncharacterized protein